MRTVFVGDVHGCAAELEELLGAVGFAAGSDRLLLTGDAFSRGPEPQKVWDAIRATGADMVLGNHDDRLLRQLRAAAAGGQVRFRRHHQGITFQRLQPLADEILPWLESLPLYIQGRPQQGEDPAKNEAIRQEDAPDPCEPLSRNPPSGEYARQGEFPPKNEPIHPDGFILVHAGINPERGLAGTERAEFLTIRTWPPTNTLEGPRWHRALEPGPGTVVFGHDAPGGLTMEYLPGRSHPWLVGLDSGCVYGGQLSAWVLEEDRLVQVPSRQPGL